MKLITLLLFFVSCVWKLEAQEVAFEHFRLDREYWGEKGSFVYILPENMERVFESLKQDLLPYCMSFHSSEVYDKTRTQDTVSVEDEDKASLSAERCRADREMRSDIVKDKETGDTVRGKHVAYQVTRGEFVSRNRGYVIKNVNLPDTLVCFNNKQRWSVLTKRVTEQIKEVVLEQFRAEDSVFLFSIPETEKSHRGCTVCFVLDESLKIKNVVFTFPGHSDFWINLLVDYFFRMEKAMLEMNLDVDANDKAWIEEKNLNNSFNTIFISSRHVQKKLAKLGT